MKTRVLFLVFLISGTAAAAGVDSSGGKRRIRHLCDDSIADGGFRAELSSVSGDQQELTLVRKTKRDQQVVASDTLPLRRTAGKFRIYSNDTADNRLELTLSAPDHQGRRSAVIVHTNKIRALRIPAEGSLLCDPVSDF